MKEVKKCIKYLNFLINCIYFKNYLIIGAIIINYCNPQFHIAMEFQKLCSGELLPMETSKTFKGNYLREICR